MIAIKIVNRKARTITKKEKWIFSSTTNKSTKDKVDF